MSKIPQKVIEREHFSNAMYSVQDLVDGVSMKADERESILSKIRDMDNAFERLYKLVPKEE